MIYERSLSQIDDVRAMQRELLSCSRPCRFGSAEYRSLMRTWNTLGGYTFGRDTISDPDYRRCVRTFKRASDRWPRLWDALGD